MQATETKRIFILLTRYLDNFSKLFQLITFGNYTHASINIEGGSEYYSFCTKGFRLERPFLSRNPQKREAPCALFQLEVSDEVFIEMKNRIEDFQASADQYRYSFLGIVLCLLGFPIKREKYYFCSQFVSELITLSGAARLHKPPSLYLPDDFIMESGFKLCFQGRLCQLAEYV